MNRSDQAPAPVQPTQPSQPSQPTQPTQPSQPQARLPRALADARRRAAHLLLQQRDGSPRTRRGTTGTTGVAVAIAALAVPMLPNPAFGSATSAGHGSAKQRAPHASQPDTRSATQPSDTRTGIAHHPPLIPTRPPANTKQMMAPARQAALRAISGPNVRPGAGTATDSLTQPPAPHQPPTTADTAAYPCPSPVHPAGNDSHMLAHVNPITDPMDVVIPRHPIACAARVDYLSQARA